MVNFNYFVVYFTTLFCVFTLGLSAEVNNDDTKDYIVYMGSISNTYSLLSEHINVLQQVVEGKSAEEKIIRSYKRSFNGFAARLTQKEYENIKGMKEVVSVFPSRTLQLQTTRSWDFLGIPEASPEQERAESNMIIGVIDSGIWPESPSFNDDGLGPVPTKWKGGCFAGQNFTCNKKIIGARGYVGDSPRDDEGHGSHTASTAAGQKVDGASFYGIAKGTARGGVPSARIAVYKVCGVDGCKEADIMAAFDDAIADGVDLITISIGGDPNYFYMDGIAIGAFHAMKKGVLTVQSAGNNGDTRGSVGSVAPWILTVAASSMDRRIVSKIVLANGKTLIGNSVNSFTLKGDKFPIIDGESATNHKCILSNAGYCIEDCLDESKVKGKILVCNNMPSPSSLQMIINIGALGVLGKSSTVNVSFIFPLPAATLDETQFAVLKSFLNSTKDPMANILKSEAMNDTSAPIVAQFSSRGPNRISADILKPDISAPGVDILAAYSQDAPVTKYSIDKRSVAYSVLSGTSMACPHVAGVAAYVKSVHPDWSPAAIKSAIMTTADTMSSSKEFSPASGEAEFAYGSGHINPSGALHPGLVYEATESDYITFLCNSGYAPNQIATFTGNNSITCPNKTHVFPLPNDVNYPTISAGVDVAKSFTVKFTRSVINVGGLNSTYTAKVTSSSDVVVTVNPDTLTFKTLREIKSFEVTVVGKGLLSLSSSSLVWSDGIHSVRSPIVVYPK